MLVNPGCALCNVSNAQGIVSNAQSMVFHCPQHHFHFLGHGFLAHSIISIAQGMLFITQGMISIAGVSFRMLWVLWVEGLQTECEHTLCVERLQESHEP